MSFLLWSPQQQEISLNKSLISSQEAINAPSTQEKDRTWKERSGNMLAVSSVSVHAQPLEKFWYPLRCINGTVLLRMKLVSISFCSLVKHRRVQQAHDCTIGMYCYVPAAWYLPASASSAIQQQANAYWRPVKSRSSRSSADPWEDERQEQRWPQCKQPPHQHATISQHGNRTGRAGCWHMGSPQWSKRDINWVQCLCRGSSQ